MKIVTLFPESYSLLSTIQKQFKKLNIEFMNLNYLSFFQNFENRLITKTIGLPKKVRQKMKIHDLYRRKINKKYLDFIYNYKPDMVLVYNDQYLTYETAEEIKKISKLVFLLGDNPFFFGNHPLKELGMYINADFVFSADSFISESFKKAGQKNVTEIYLGYDPEVCYPKQPTPEEREIYQSDVVMIGRLYPNIISSWTYKRLYFYNQFRNLNLKIYGHGWHKYKKVFPELMDKVISLDRYLSFDEINTILSCSKVYPIDTNPGIVNGIHLRVFDCIGSEILPIVEYTKDLEKVFKEVEIPMIKDYSQAEKIARCYIENDEKRERVKHELKEFIDSYYTPEQAIKKIIEFVLD